MNPDLMWLVLGYQITQAIYVAAKLGIADLVPRTGGRATTSPASGRPECALPAAARAGRARRLPRRTTARVRADPARRRLRADVPGSLAGWAA